MNNFLKNWQAYCSNKNNFYNKASDCTAISGASIHGGKGSLCNNKALPAHIWNFCHM